MAFHTADWWKVDSMGRKIGWMWPEDFEAMLEAAYGDRRWVIKFCYEFGYSRATVDRYRTGALPIPKPVACAVHMLSAMRMNKVPFDGIEAPWLPEVDGSAAKLGPAIPTRLIEKVSEARQRELDKGKERAKKSVAARREAKEAAAAEDEAAV
jgi:hypothetical protein